jgi:hypothetical protein
MPPHSWAIASRGLARLRCDRRRPIGEGEARFRRPGGHAQVARRLSPSAVQARLRLVTTRMESSPLPPRRAASSRPNCRPEVIARSRKHDAQSFPAPPESAGRARERAHCCCPSSLPPFLALLPATFAARLSRINLPVGVSGMNEETRRGRPSVRIPPPARRGVDRCARRAKLSRPVLAASASEKWLVREGFALTPPGETGADGRSPSQHLLDAGRGWFVQLRDEGGAGAYGPWPADALRLGVRRVRRGRSDRVGHSLPRLTPSSSRATGPRRHRLDLSGRCAHAVFNRARTVLRSQGCACAPFFVRRESARRHAEGIPSNETSTSP